METTTTTTIPDMIAKIIEACPRQIQEDIASQLIGMDANLEKQLMAFNEKQFSEVKGDPILYSSLCGNQLFWWMYKEDPAFLSDIKIFFDLNPNLAILEQPKWASQPLECYTIRAFQEFCAHLTLTKPKTTPSAKSSVQRPSVFHVRPPGPTQNLQHPSQ